MKFHPTKPLPPFFENGNHWECILALDSIQAQLMNIGVQLQRIADAMEEMADKKQSRECVFDE